MLSKPDMNEICHKIQLMLGEVRWTVRVREHKYEGLYVVFEGTMPNVYNPAQTVDLRVNSQIFGPALSDQTSFKEWLLHRWLKICAHEALEGFRIDGKPYVDPHQPPEEWFI
jgi:hypothetical protein